MIDNHIQLCAEQLPESSRPEFIRYVNDLLDKDQWYGIGPDFLGFMDDYVSLRDLIERHIVEPSDGIISWKESNFIIYDVGCATAIQHVFFGKCKGYVGISPPGPPIPQFFLPRCSFYSGYLSEVVDEMDIDYENSFGIANMSILYDRRESDELEIFNRVFKRKFII
ncbi:hypothetical protein M0R72_01405 [Candidatus Pacearchaeota archaeon]|jgi:hypothetical protein|nr:hypothetical protein [Candidatus Pacearchaeota archaeon]